MVRIIAEKTTSADDAEAVGRLAALDLNRALTVVLESDRCEKRHFWSHFILKVIILPRQARDKHRKSRENRAFCTARQTSAQRWRRWARWHGTMQCGTGSLQATLSPQRATWRGCTDCWSASRNERLYLMCWTKSSAQLARESVSPLKRRRSSRRSRWSTQPARKTPLRCRQHSTRQRTL
eukprot:COSAG06_NODE_4583_length_4126_cov_7.728582_5_plen_180_part_00